MHVYVFLFKSHPCHRPSLLYFFKKALHKNFQGSYMMYLLTYQEVLRGEKKLSCKGHYVY